MLVALPPLDLGGSSGHVVLVLHHFGKLVCMLVLEGKNKGGAITTYCACRLHQCFVFLGRTEGDITSQEPNLASAAGLTGFMQEEAAYCTC